MVADHARRAAHRHGAGDARGRRARRARASARAALRTRSRAGPRRVRGDCSARCCSTSAIFLLPDDVDVALAGRRAPRSSDWRAGRGRRRRSRTCCAASTASFGANRGSAGSCPAAALFGLLLCRRRARAIATKVGVDRHADAWSLAHRSRAHHWLGSFAPDIDVLLALYMVMVALLIGLGISALELDLRQVRLRVAPGVRGL